MTGLPETTTAPSSLSWLQNQLLMLPIPELFTRTAFCILKYATYRCSCACWDTTATLNSCVLKHTIENTLLIEDTKWPPKHAVLEQTLDGTIVRRCVICNVLIKSWIFCHVFEHLLVLLFESQCHLNDVNITCHSDIIPLIYIYQTHIFVVCVAILRNPKILLELDCMFGTVNIRVTVILPIFNISTPSLAKWNDKHGGTIWMERWQIYLPTKLRYYLSILHQNKDEKN